MKTKFLIVLFSILFLINQSLITSVFAEQFVNLKQTVYIAQAEGEAKGGGVGAAGAGKGAVAGAAAEAGAAAGGAVTAGISVGTILTGVAIVGAIVAGMIAISGGGEGEGVTTTHATTAHH